MGECLTTLTLDDDKVHHASHTPKYTTTDKVPNNIKINDKYNNCEIDPKMKERYMEIIKYLHGSYILQQKKNIWGINTA